MIVKSTPRTKHRLWIHTMHTTHCYIKFPNIEKTNLNIFWKKPSLIEECYNLQGHSTHNSSNPHSHTNSTNLKVIYSGFA